MTQSMQVMEMIVFKGALATTNSMAIVAVTN